jgi:hypothetical protein
MAKKSRPRLNNDGTPRNPQDATLRNVRALKKRVDQLERGLAEIDQRLWVVEHHPPTVDNK